MRNNNVFDRIINVLTGISLLFVGLRAHDLYYLETVSSRVKYFVIGAVVVLIARYVIFYIRYGLNKLGS